MKPRTFHKLAFVAVFCLSALPLWAADTAPKPDAPKEGARTEKADPNLIEGWGRWQDPDRDCKYKVDAGKLLIWVPGTAHDLSVEQNKMNAPMVLKETSGDFDVVVKISGTFTPGEATVTGRTPYQGSGLVLAQDNRNYLRLERAVYTGGGQNHHYVNFEVRINGQVQRIGQSTDYPVRENIPVYLRIERRGVQVRGSVSEDGTNWHNLAVKDFVAVPKLFAGLAAVNATDAPLTIQYESLKIMPVKQAER